MKLKVKKWITWLWKEWIMPILIACAFVIPVRSSLADWYWVPTGSMTPTILEVIENHIGIEDRKLLQEQYEKSKA